MKEIHEKNIFKLTIPIFLELLLMTVVGNIDIIMVSKYSDKGVGVLGGMSQILYTQNIIFGFISIGTGILVAQYIGAKKNDKIGSIIAVSLALNLLISLIVGGIYGFFAKEILTKIKLNQELIAIGLNYMRLVGGICIFQGISITISSALRSFGYTKIPLYINILINLLNILGNGMFLFGWLGAPILGVTGVGVSTVIARGIGVIFSLYCLKKYCKFQFLIEYLRPFPKDIFKYILKIGIPSGAEHLCWNLAQIGILTMVNTMGTPTITARTYLNLIASFIMLFSIALGQGTAIITGRNIGARNIKAAYKQCIESLKLSLAAVFILLIVIFIFQDQIMRFFTKDLEVISIAKKVFWVFFIIEIGRTFNIIIINSLHAAGDVKYPMIAAIFSMFGVAVTLSYLFGIKMEMALVGVWLANGVDEWVRGILMLKRWNSMKWKKKRFI